MTQIELLDHRCISTYLLGFASLIAVGDEEAGCEDGQGWVEQAGLGAVGVQYEYPCGEQYALIGVAFAGEKQFAVAFEEVVGRDGVDVVLQGAEYFCFVDADLLLEFLHLVLVEGLHAHGLAADYAVEGSAEVLDSTVHVLDFGGQQVAGSEHDEPIEVQVGLLVEEDSGDVQGQGRDRVGSLQFPGQLHHELHVLAGQVILQFQGQSETRVPVHPQFLLLYVEVYHYYPGHPPLSARSFGDLPRPLPA